MTSPCAARRIATICCAVFLFIPLLVSLPSRAQSQGGDTRRGEAKAAACGACHGSRVRTPLPRMPVLDGQPEQFLVLQMILMREGLRDVPQMAGMLKDFSDRDLTDIAAAYSRRPPMKNTLRRNEARYVRGAQLAHGMGCGSCHRADYTGQQQMPRLAGQREDYLADTMKAYRDNRRSGTDTSMNGVLYQVSDADIEALAHFLALQ